MLTLHYNSPSARLYRWFYLDENMPKSLCGYFWKITIAWLFSIPLFVFSLPTLFLRFFAKGEEWTFNNRAIFSIIGWIIGLSAFCMGVATVTFGSGILPTDNSLIQAQLMGFFFYGCFVVWGAFYVLGKALSKFDERNAQRSNMERKKTWFSLMAEFTKAKYQKICPAITWDK